MDPEGAPETGASAPDAPGPSGAFLLAAKLPLAGFGAMQRKAFDEMHDGSDRVREHYREFDRWLSEQSPDAMQDKRAEADPCFDASASRSRSMATRT